MNKTILDIDPNDRKVLLIGDYSEIETVITQNSDDKLKKMVKTAGISMAGRLAARTAFSLVNPLGAALVVGAADLIGMKSWKEKEVTTELTYIKVPLKQAFDNLEWKGSISPQKNTFYIKNPHNDKVYFPAKSFHSIAFEEKYNEAIRLLMSLKPKELTVEYREGYSQEINARFSGGKKAVKGQGNFQMSNERGKEILFKAEFRKPSLFSKAKLPSDLIWYPTEEKWLSVVDGVLNHGLEKVEMDISYNDDFGINAELQASIAKILGGKAKSDYTKFTKTLWKVNATFW
ncbi:hypothetical protein [Paenibacillus sp. Marseille-Q9583]